MNWIEKQLVETNIWVAICFTALVAFFQMNLYTPKFSVWGIAFFGTLAIYNLTRIGSIQNLNLKPFRTQLILSIIGLIGTLICIVLRNFDLKVFLYLSVLGIISFCYSLPFSGLGLRTIPFLKLFLIAIVWTASSIGLLLIIHEALLPHFTLFLSVFLFVAGITIPFDIRDSNIDDSNLQTIPQIIGVNSSRYLSMICILFSAMFMMIEFPIETNLGASWMLTCMISVLFCWKSSPDKPSYYFGFWMEGLSVLPLLFSLIFNYLPS